MIGSGISESDFHANVTRRHCIAVLLAALAAGTLPARAAAPAPKLLVLGDSLSAEYGLQRGSGWVALMTERLGRQLPGATVVNASISGDTTSGGRSRLPALLQQHRPTHVVIELGANDALRGLPMTMTEDNLRAMVKASRAAGAQVLLVGTQVPPNYGSAYTKQFAATFRNVADGEKVALVPFMLAGVADVPEAASLFQADRLHPNERAHPRILENIWRVLWPWLKA
jgi:acyl-CoA thioesterase-1